MSISHSPATGLPPRSDERTSIAAGSRPSRRCIAKLLALTATGGVMLQLSGCIGAVIPIAMSTAEILLLDTIFQPVLP